MTVCIAAIADGDEYIVAAYDRRLSYKDYVEANDSAAQKRVRFSKKWSLMFAANDLSPVSSLVDDIKVRLSPYDDDRTLSEVRDAVLSAYRNTFIQQVFGEHIAKYGFSDMADFRENALRQLGQELFSQVIEKIDTFDLGVAFLVYGFDEWELPHIFEVKNPGVFVDHDIEGFGVIGSGTWPAMASLTRRKFAPHDALVSVIYRVSESKFCAETAAGVGKRSSVQIVTREGKIKFLLQKQINALRDIWVAENAAPIPKEAEKQIQLTVTSQRKLVPAKPLEKKKKS